MFKRQMIMAPAGETSSGGAVANAEIFENADVNESFDNMEYESEASKRAGEAFNDKFKERIERAKKAKEGLDEDGDEEKPKAKKEKSEPKEPKEKKGSDIDTLPDSDTDLDGKEVKPKEKKAEKKEEESDLKDEKPESEKTEEEKKVDSKKLKIRMSDGLYAVEPDSKVRVKIDGEFQEVPMQELINNYSGKVAYDKKFTEIGSEKKAIETAKAEVAKTQTFLKDTLSEIVGKLNDPNANPFDAMSILVEKAGQDQFTIWKRTIEANLDEVEKLMSMDEIARENYYLKKEKEFRTKSEDARKAVYHKEQAFNQAVQKVNSLRQAHNVSEEQYVNALDELEAEGTDTTKMTDEQVIEYASLKPHVTTVQDVLEPYEESISDSNYSKVVQKLARELRSGDYTKEQLTEWARKEFLDEDLKDLQSRTKEVQKRTTKEVIKTPEKFESFADFDD